MTKSPIVLTAFLAVMLALASGALAQSLELQVDTGQQPGNSISVCPDSVVNSIRLDVTNLGTQTDTIGMTLDWPSDLGFIKPFVTLASGESARISPFWLTIPYNMEPGVYHAKVTAESSMTGDEVSRDIEIEVMKCHAVFVVSDDNFRTSCRESEEPAAYDIIIGNEGKWPETFELSASAEWAEFSSDSVSVDAGATVPVSLVLNPPAGMSSGTHTVFITARSTESYAVDTASVELEISDCMEFSSSIDPLNQEACLGESRDYELTINNEGESEDHYSIDVPEWVFPDRTMVTLQGGDSETVTLTVQPDTEGLHPFEVIVTSERDSSAEPQSLTGTVNAEECRGVAVIVTPSEQEACQGDELDLSVSIKNTGTVKGTFVLSSTYGVLEQDSVTLEGGKASTFDLMVDTSDIPTGTVAIEVTAQDGRIADTATTEIRVEECFDASLRLQPEEVTVCPGARIPYTMTIDNTGKQADTYTLSYADQEKVVTLDAGEKRAVSYDYMIPYVEEGRYIFSVELTSEGGIDLLETSEISLRDSETCYGVELSDDMGIVNVGKAATVEVAIKNTGEQADTYKVEMLSGPDWAFLEPTEITLSGGEEDTLYLYLSPLFGTEQKSYVIKVRAESDHSSDELFVDVIVPQNGTIVTPSEPDEEPSGNGTGDNETMDGEPEENGTAEPSEPGNISINVTHSDETEGGEEGSPVTGGAVEERPFWKTAAVAFIALIIVGILVLRFVLLLKK